MSSVGSWRSGCPVDDDPADFGCTPWDVSRHAVVFRHALLQDGIGGLASSARRRSGRIFVLAAAESGNQFEHGVERGFERFGVALNLGE
jgi:hypothetical protein